MTRTQFPASLRQLNYLRNLIAQKVMDPEVAKVASEAIERPDFTGTMASAMLDRFTKLPDRPKDARPVPPAKAHLVGLPHSKYALPAGDLVANGAGELAGHNDLGFFEIKEYRGTVYMRQLFGAPGSFNRERISADNERAVAALIRTAPLVAAQRFAAHYTCCAKCGAELTVKESRDLGLGPTCRGQFGL